MNCMESVTDVGKSVNMALTWKGSNFPRHSAAMHNSTGMLLPKKCPLHKHTYLNLKQPANGWWQEKSMNWCSIIEAKNLPTGNVALYLPLQQFFPYWKSLCAHRKPNAMKIIRPVCTTDGSPGVCKYSKFCAGAAQKRLVISLSGAAKMPAIKLKPANARLHDAASLKGPAGKADLASSLSGHACAGGSGSFAQI